MRKIILICSLLLFTIATYAQNTTVTIDTVNATTAGQKISVPVRVSNFNNILAVTLAIQYNPAVAQFDSISGQPSFLAGANGGTIMISRAALQAVAPANGVLLNLHFTYSGGNTGLTFNTALNELSNSNGIVPATYFNGAILNPSSNISIKADSVTAGNVNSAVIVPVRVTNFTNIGAVTLKIQYNPAVIQFDSVSSGFIGGASAGVVTIARAQLSAIPAPGGVLLNMYFRYLGGSSTLAFDAAQSEITDLTNGIVNDVNYINGLVSNPNQVLTLQVGTVTPTAINANLAVPVTVDNFTNIGAVTLKVQYDPAVARFDSVSIAGGFIAGASGGVITVSRASLTAVTPDSGKIFDLNFTYLGGSSDLTIDASQSELTSLSTGVIPASNINYVNGRINGNNSISVALGLGTVTGIVGGTVAVPLNVDNFTNIGAITLKINYDPALVQFDSVSRGDEFVAGATGGVLTIARAGLTAITPDSGKVLDVYFRILAAGTASLNFDVPISEIVTTTGVIINANYTNGSIQAAAADQITVALANVTATAVNQTVAVPLNVDNLVNIGAITLKIQYNPAVAQFDSASRGIEFLTNASGGVITIARASLTAVIPDSGKLLDLYFKYLGGSTNLVFDAANSEIANLVTGPVAGVNYVNGSIGGASSITVKLDSVSAGSANQKVTVPLRVTNFTNIGAFTFKIAYDPFVATFDSASGQPGLVTGASGGFITLARAALTAVTPTNGIIANLHFTYLGGNTNLAFDAAGSEVADLTTGPVSGVIYINGRISLGVNSLPTFTAVMPNSTVSEGQLLTFDYNATDLNTGDTIRYSLVAPAPAGAIIGQNDGIFMWTPTFTQSGTYTIVVAASDGQGITRDTAIVTVVNVNREPVFTKVLTQSDTIKYDQPPTFTFQYEATDADSDPLAYRLLNAPAGASISATGLLTYIPSAAGMNVTFTVVVSDTAGGDDTTTVNMTTVLDVFDPGSIPTVYELNQNYPNPFNPTTSIRFSLPSEAFVSLKVYNLLGEEVAKLVNETLPAAYHEYRFDATNLGSGIYIYRLEAGKFVSTKKMILVK